MKTMKYRKSIDIIFTMVYGFISLINVSCDDFLSEKEVPRITSDFYKTEQGILAAVDAPMLICVLELVESSLMFLQN